MSPIHQRSSYATIIKSAQRRLSPDEYEMFYHIAIEGESFAAIGTADNIVYVWADFGTDASPRYTSTSNDFDGDTTTNTPSC